MVKKSAFLILICLIFCLPGHADQPAPYMSSRTSDMEAYPEKVFALGKSTGAAYYHLTDLYDSSRNNSFLQVKGKYGKTLQSLNIIDIILSDTEIKGNSQENLARLRTAFHDALKNRDLSETRLASVQDMFVNFYEGLVHDVKTTYGNRESWFLTLGFYTSFQLESLQSPREEKILLSGFSQILNTKPVRVPKDIYHSLLVVNSLDKLQVSESELLYLESNLEKVIKYFSKSGDLAGFWQGILINPDNEMLDIQLDINKDLSARMNIDGIASNVEISDVRVVNDYLTFMFKPFGTEKLYLKFDARLSDNMFAGRITDVLGEKGYWVLARTDREQVLSGEKLDKMASYVRQMEKRLQVPDIQEEIPVSHTKKGPTLEEVRQEADEILAQEEEGADILVFLEEPEKEKGFFSRLFGKFFVKFGHLFVKNVINRE